MRPTDGELTLAPSKSSGRSPLPWTIRLAARLLNDLGRDLTLAREALDLTVDPFPEGVVLEEESASP